MQRNNVKMGWVLHVKRLGFGNDKVSVLKIIHIPIFGVNFVFSIIIMCCMYINPLFNGI